MINNNVYMSHEYRGLFSPSNTKTGNSEIQKLVREFDSKFVKAKIKSKNRNL